MPTAQNAAIELRTPGAKAWRGFVSTKAELRYDPMGRLYQATNYVNGVSQGAKVFLHDGDALVAVLNSSGTTLERHAHGPAVGVACPREGGGSACKL